MKTLITTTQQQATFDEWMAEHLAILHHVARGFAAADDRDDLLQDILLAVWKAVPHFRGQCKPSTFIYRVAHNAALGWRRAQRSYEKRLEDAKTAAACAAPDSSGTPREEQQQLEMLYAAIRELPELDRSLILLSLDGISYEEMSSIHGLSASNVGARLHRIRQRLTTILQKGEEL